MPDPLPTSDELLIISGTGVEPQPGEVVDDGELFPPSEFPAFPPFPELIPTVLTNVPFLQITGSATASSGVSTTITFDTVVRANKYDLVVPATALFYSTSGVWSSSLQVEATYSAGAATSEIRIDWGGGGISGAVSQSRRGPNAAGTISLQVTDIQFDYSPLEDTFAASVLQNSGADVSVSATATLVHMSSV